jgi:hypothetical protein
LHAAVTAALAVCLIHPSGADAQGLRLTPWLGLYAPTSDVGAVQAVEFGKQKSTLAFGGDLDIGGSSFLGLRASGSFATSSDVPIDGVGCAACETRRNVFALTGGLVLRPLPLPGIRPYATAGAGIKWYDFNHDGQGVNALLNDQQQFTFNIGAGVLLMPASPMGIVIEANDYMSRFEFESGEKSDTQHDLFLKIGLSFGMGGAGN